MWNGSGLQLLSSPITHSDTDNETLHQERRTDGIYRRKGRITLPALWGDDPTGLGQRGGSSTAV